jgi:hypothetical protein
MRKNVKYKPKFFPFSPGIPWGVDRGKYILPEIDFETWHKSLDGRDITITAFGGLFESFFSLCAAEAIVSFDSSHKLYWLGNNKYSFFSKAQGLCKSSLINITPDTLKNYPVPLFFDCTGNAYFNILYNYKKRISWWGKYPELINFPVAEQIAKNIMIPWRNYIPKLRNLGNDFFDDLYSTGKIRLKSKVVTIILNGANNSSLNWSVANIKEFAQLASHKGLKVILFTTNSTNVFHGTNILANEYNIRNILQTINKSWVVLSNDVDWLLISLMMSDAKIISRHTYNQYDLFKNAEFMGVDNDIFTNVTLSPIDVFSICKGLL